MKIIDEHLIDSVTEEALASPRLRMNRNFHESPDDPVQRMLNAVQPGSYLRPHRHPDREELFLLLRGAVRILIFENDGTLRESFVLAPELKSYGVTIPYGHWHSLFSLEHGTVFLEVKQGPYLPLAEEHFAPWAPKPDDPEGINGFFTKYGNLSPTTVSR